MYLGNHVVQCKVNLLFGLPKYFLLESRDVGITPHLCQGKGWEPQISNIILRTVEKGFRVVDIGANVGWHSMHMLNKIGGSGKFLGVEAQPRTYELLYKTMEYNGYGGRDVVKHCAVSSKSGSTIEMTFKPERTLNNNIAVAPKPSKDAEYIYSSQGAHLAKPTTPEVASNAVPTCTIDELLADWKGVDFIKIDVEGAEADAFDGMEQTINKNPEVIVFMEINTSRMTFRGGDPKKFYEKIKAHFPILRRIENDGVYLTNVEQMLAHKVGDIFLYLSKSPKLAPGLHGMEKGR